MTLPRPKILTFVGYYCPGYKAGGPLRTIANMVDHLGEDCEFLIVARDRDLGDTEAYPDFPLDQWVTSGRSSVFYLSPEKQTVSELAKVIQKTPHDVLYLNSFFDPVCTLQPLLARFFGLSPRRPVILAVRGEFSPEALKIKRTKKIAYMFVARLVGLHKGITWQATSEHEAKDIMRTLRVASDAICIASDLPAKVVRCPPTANGQTNVASEAQGGLRIVFLSRISPMKNLDYALRVLSFVRAKTVFDIYGPIEDVDYWQECQTLLKKLPPHIQVRYCGVVLPAKVCATFAQYDLFLFPSRGENYGHVIAESLGVGTAVLISDRTPWRNLTTAGLGWDLPLSEMQDFVAVIEGLALKHPGEREKMRHQVQTGACERFTDPAALVSNRQLFTRHLAR
jgi:glycosyltransferase involved in cell wall biosynthesis